MPGQMRPAACFPQPFHASQSITLTIPICILIILTCIRELLFVCIIAQWLSQYKHHCVNFIVWAASCLKQILPWPVVLLAAHDTVDS